MRTFAVRLAPGSDLRAELERLTRERGLLAGCIVSCVGSLVRARLRAPGLAGEADVVLAWDEPMEIVALSGTLGLDGMHVHVALSRRDGACVGGHLVGGCVVHTTCELMIGELEDVIFRRRADPATGYLELSVEPRGKPEL